MVQPIEQQDDPLQPLGQSLQQGRTAAQPAPGFEPGQLLDGWNKWVEKPNNRAALMQFGIAMLQPMGMGESGSGHFANALGSAGEAHQRVTSQEQQARREDTAATLRESTAAARETTAGAAEMRALHAGERNELSDTIRRQRLELDSARAYDAYVKSTEAANEKIRSGNILAPRGQEKPESPILKPEEWRGSRGGAAVPGAVGLAPPAVGGAPGATTQPRWVDVQREPKVQSQISFAKQQLATGSPKAKEETRRWIEQTIMPRLAPAERSLVYATMGIAP